MSLFEFVTEEELDALPGYGPKAFIQLVRIAEARFRSILGRYDAESQEGWLNIEYYQCAFMGCIVAFAEQCNVPDIGRYDVPGLENFRAGQFRQFQLDLNAAMSRLALEQLGGRQGTVAIGGAGKDRIRTYLHHLKVQIDQLELEAGRRKKLQACLEEFEAELDKRRTGIAPMTACRPKRTCASACRRSLA